MSSDGQGVALREGRPLPSASHPIEKRLANLAVELDMKGLGCKAGGRPSWELTQGIPCVDCFPQPQNRRHATFLLLYLAFDVWGCFRTKESSTLNFT